MESVAKPVHHTATVEETWDGPGAVADMPNEESTLNYCHAWRDPDGDPDAKSTYKFPHHKTNGGPANLAACRNGLSRLSQANIPESDKPGVRSHLQAHLNDAGGEDDRVNHRLRARSGSGKKWYRIENNDLPGTEEPAEIFVYDEISYWGVTAQDFVRDLQGIDKDRIVLHLNTPGGDVFDGIAIYNALRQHRAHVTTMVDGLAASIGSIIAMAGDEIVMGNYSQVMIHNAMGAVYGNASDMRELADLLDKTSANLAQVYADRTGTSVDEWRALMDAETWFTAEEAVDFGLADRVMEDSRRVENKFDLSHYRYKNRAEAPDPRSRAAGTHPATPPEPGRNVLVPARTTTEKAAAPPEGVADAEPAFVFDPEAFMVAMRYAAEPPVEKEEEPFHFDPAVFKAMMAFRTANAPAVSKILHQENPPSFESVFDPDMLRARIIEGVRSD